jgi:2'-5' RNA ligase
MFRFAQHDRQSGTRGHLTMAREIVIAYWLIPAGPAHRYFRRVINDFAQQYNAPHFEPHVTVHVGANCTGIVNGVLSKAAAGCKQIELQALEVSGSSEFVKTLFVQFAMSKQLQQLNQNIRTASQDSSDYQLNPHLSLLYKKISIQDRRLLMGSIEMPFSAVTFDSLKAVRCISPTQSRADVEAWHVVAETSLGAFAV